MRTSIATSLAAFTAIRLAPLLCRALLACSLLAVTAAAGAQQLILTISQPDQVGPAGVTYTFSGTITNDTGSALQTSDLFFDFSGFDPAFLTLQQLIGNVVSTIADGSTSASLQLFELTLASGAAPGATFSSDVMLQDANQNLSDPRTVSVTVVPEPGVSTLFVAGLVPVAWWVNRRRKLQVC